MKQGEIAMRLPRLRIARVMIFIAFIALNLGTARAILGFRSENAILWTQVTMLGLGCLSMLNVLAIGLLMAYRWRGSRSFVQGFEVFGITALVLYIAVVTLFTEEVVRPFRDRVILPLAYLLREGPYITLTGELLAYLIFGALVSLPQIAFAAIGGLLTSRRSRPGLIAVLAGPLVGGIAATVGISWGGLNPADWGFYTILGVAVGSVVGMTLALVACSFPGARGDGGDGGAEAIGVIRRVTSVDPS
jgi:hypothetical protein